MNKVRVILLTLVLMLFIGVAVSTSEPVNAATISTTYKYKTITCKKTKINYKLSYTGNYTIYVDTSCKSWVNVAKTDTGILITTAKNTTSATRRAYVTVKNAEKTKKIKITITQRPYNILEYKFSYNWKEYKCWENGMKIHPADITNSFLKKVIVVSGKLGIKPDDLMAVMAFESHVNHKAVNKNSKATGLIQFTNYTVGWLGKLPEINRTTSLDDLKNMTANEQLTKYCYYYFVYTEKWFGQMGDLGDVYMGVFCPEAIGKSNSAVLYNISKNADAYRNNYNLDTNHDGNITKAECLKQVTDHRTQAVPTYIAYFNP